MAKEMTTHATDLLIDHIPRQSIGEKEGGDLEYDGENFDEQVKLQLPQTFAFALELPATFDNRSGSVSELLVQPLLAQHHDPCGQKRHKIRVQKAQYCDDLCRGPFHVWGTVWSVPGAID